MTPRCRRSARIASSSKRSKDSPAPQQLASVAETQDVHETPSKSKPASRATREIASSPMPAPAPTTPSGAAPPKLAMSEMHPSKAHQTMAPPSSGLRHGFTDIDYTKTPMQTLLHNTPSKTPVPSSAFTFRSTGIDSDRGLGPEAQRIMESVREEAAAIKVQLAAERARERDDERKASEGRKIAAARGKSGRFSAAHIAEFKKMDSIEGHPSSFRGAPGRFTPVKATATMTPSMPVTPLKPGVKRSQSKANLDDPDSARPKTLPPRLLSRSIEKMPVPHSAKRVRQHMEDDAATHRPVSRDASSIPRPKSSGNDSLSSGIPRSQTLGSLATPSKSSLARANSVKASTIALVRSPSQPDIHKINSFSAKVGTAFTRSPSKTDLGLLARSPSKKHFGLKWNLSNNSGAEGSHVPSRIETPGRFGRIKSILKRQASGTKPKSGIPQLAASASKTPSRSGVSEDMFPSVPLTTPGRRHDRRVDFTPETKRAAMAQDSPSPVKSSIPRSTAFPKLPAPKFTAGGKGAVKPKSTGEVAYPDLSAYQVDEDESEHPAESVPGTFTFRSDHTIQVNDSPSKGFGSSAGQASLRQVRKSTTAPIQMPGSFPRVLEGVSEEASPNKENDAPLSHNGIPHGITNKKRHRAGSDDEDEDEGAKRGTKKQRKNPKAPEGAALMAPRLVARASPTKKAMTPPTPSPKKKKTGLSLSRLQMLAQPKIRK